jgi:type I restriction enzyme S subunit
MVDYANSRSSGANLPRLSPKELANFQVPLPPLEEQKRIAKILDAADALLAKRRESLAQLDALMQSTFLGLFGDPVKNEKGWDKVDIGNIARAKPNNGVFRKNDEYTERDGFGVPVVWLEELFKGSKIDVTNARRLPLESKEVAKYGLNYGDILFCRSSLKLDGIAYNNVYLGEDKAAAFECHLIRVSPDLNECDPIFLSAQLRTPPLRACLKSVSKTSTMTTIDQKAISGISVIVPPMEIQSKFARFSASVDLQKEKIRIAIGELDSLFLSLQQKAFSGGI